tara:strand:+ start:3497 stop:3685 length:189 start_codon:yes stop_codon:yes gene_type:complete
MNYPLYHHQNNIYKILKKIYHHNFPNIEQVKKYKDSLLACDHVLKDQTHYLFCETVQEAGVC